jgi:hypothetical protein
MSVKCLTTLGPGPSDPSAEEVEDQDQEGGGRGGRGYDRHRGRQLEEGRVRLQNLRRRDVIKVQPPAPPGANIINFFCPQFTDSRNELQGLSLVSLSNPVSCLWVRPE